MNLKNSMMNNDIIIDLESNDELAFKFLQYYMDAMQYSPEEMAMHLNIVCDFKYADMFENLINEENLT